MIRGHRRDEQTTPRVFTLDGSDRETGMTAALITSADAGAASAGASREDRRLSDRPIAFCGGCRACTQPRGPAPGPCRHADGLGAIGTVIETADARILASPTDVGSVTAVTPRFSERLIGDAEWPWGRPAPRPRLRPHLKCPAGLITASAVATPRARLRPITDQRRGQAAQRLGPRVVGRRRPGRAAQAPQPRPGVRTQRRAERMDARLIDARQEIDSESSHRTTHVP
jgi:hypothetical protein